MNALQWFEVIVSLAVQVTAITIVAVALERRAPAAMVKTRVWVCYYAALVGLLAAGLLLPRAQWIHPWQTFSDGDLLRMINLQQAAALVLLTIWLAGLGCLAAQWMIDFWRLRRFLQHCPLAASAEQDRLRAAAPQALLRFAGRSVQFRVAPEAAGPFCYQFHQPAVYLPQSLIDGDAAELRHVLRHELTHLHTHHPLQVFVQRFVQTVFWFVPPIWTAGRRAALAREFVCDEAAVDQGASAASYLKTLLRYAELQRPGSAVLAISPSSSELRIRAQRLAQSNPARAGRVARRAPACLLLAALLLSQAWLPTNPLASPKSGYSPWPSWSAAALHVFDVSVRDFDQFEGRLQVYELSQQR